MSYDPLIACFSYNAYMFAFESQIDERRAESIDVIFQLTIADRNEFSARNIFSEISGTVTVKLCAVDRFFISVTFLIG